MTEAEKFAAVRKAHKDEQRLRAEVLAWMDAEAKALRLRRNADAPMWSDYEAAIVTKERVMREMLDD